MHTILVGFNSYETTKKFNCEHGNNSITPPEQMKVEIIRKQLVKCRSLTYT